MDSRYIGKFLTKDLMSRMVLLSGPRQCGKTTFAKWLLEHSFKGEYFNWDQVKNRKSILQQDWSEDSKLVVLDEIHKKKLWKNFVKGIYDTKPKGMQFLVTGSARLELFQKAGDSMFGRFHSWRLHPFCMAEDPLKLSMQKRFERLLEHGGFPFPYLSNDPVEVKRWRNQRWSLLLREDLRDLESVKDIQSLELLAELLKPRVAGMLSYANLAEDAEIAPKTAKGWVQILEKLYLICLVTPYSASIKRALSKVPKLYFIDQGDIVDQPMGARLENLVALNLLKRLHFIEDAYGDPLELHYLRDKEGHEVDFVITLKRRPVALLEVKSSFQEPSPSLLYFKKQTALKDAVAIQLHADAAKKAVVKQGVKIISIHEFFSAPLDQNCFWE